MYIYIRMRVYVCIWVNISGWRFESIGPAYRCFGQLPLLSRKGCFGELVVVGWLVGWMVGWLVGLAGWLVGCEVGWLVGLVGWVRWLLGWFFDWLVGWFVGWLVGVELC